MEQSSTERSIYRRERLQHFVARARRSAPFVGGILATLLALLLYNAITPKPHQITPGDVNASIANALASVTPPPAFSARVYQVIQPSLVMIEAGNLGTATPSTATPGKDTQNEGSLGSGVIIDNKGDILTSLHVVADKSGPYPDILVIFADGTHSRAKVSAQQPENDIAVLQAENPPAQIVPATLGNPRAMHVGDEAYAVGNPFGLYSSMSAGVISGFDRPFQAPGSDREIDGLIQIDAAVNPGNSGGPLLNRDGEVVGIIEGIVNPDGQSVFIGIGFAVPINIAAQAAGAPVY